MAEHTPLPGGRSGWAGHAWSAASMLAPMPIMLALLFWPDWNQVAHSRLFAWIGSGVGALAMAGAVVVIEALRNRRAGCPAPWLA